jgi:hypothetical protein
MSITHIIILALCVLVGYSAIGFFIELYVAKQLLKRFEILNRKFQDRDKQ